MARRTAQGSSLGGSSSKADAQPAAQPQRLRVAFVHPDLGIGGAERLVVDAAAGLQRLGHSVVLYTSHHDPSHCFQETRDGTLDVRVRGDWLPRALLGKGHIVFAILRNLYLALTLVLASSVSLASYDVLLVDQLSVSIPLLRLTGAKILFYCHFPDKLLTTRTSLAKQLYRIPIDFVEEMTTKMADDIVVNSQFTASVFGASFKRISKTPDVLYPGIHLDSYSATVDPASPAIKTLVSNKTTIVSINRFERKKNIGLAIRAFALLRTQAAAQFPSLRLVIAGGYDKRVAENVEHLQELVSLAHELELSTFIMDTKDATPQPTSQVVFLPSFNEAQRTYLLASSLCLVYTPSNEHFGIVPIEAMVAQLPVVAVNSGGPTETVQHGRTGFLCEPTESSFADALTRLVTGEHSKQTMGAAGRRRVVEGFTLDVFVGRLEQILYGVLRGRNAEAESAFYGLVGVVVLVVVACVSAGVLYGR
ncbi:hypothetical protein BC831DRAFT_440852 [Entophlyctis helioformis]|nr:hypothetical protein BC831DRAFT_440852 [Entophlyctis helioformis]